ncbi:F-box protein [Sesbania bispinosa]|nr:F-box protein [Sesbania bispinosa]
MTYFNLLDIPDQKVYRSKIDYFWGLSYCGSSSGYVIMASADSILMMNPFTRRKKVISIEYNLKHIGGHALLAFAKGSKEFIIVFLCKDIYSLHVYQSRKSFWDTYSREGKPWMVVDFVVLQNKIYVITDKAKIGILSLNSRSIKFLHLKNAPNVTCKYLKLVSCDEKLLVVHFEHGEILNVYKVDLLTMEYVKLENLGDIALFFAISANCYALWNPGRWGYEKNSLYYIACRFAECEVYSVDNKLQKTIVPAGLQAPRRSSFHWLDWCFRNEHNEVDYSLV